VNGVDDAADDPQVGERLALAIGDLGDYYRTAHAGDRVRRFDVDDLAREHAFPGDAERDLPGLDLDGGAPGALRDGDRRALADTDDSLAAEQDARERPLAGDDTVLREDVVLELEGHGLRSSHADGGDVTFERRNDAGLRALRERGRGEQVDGENKPRQTLSPPSDHSGSLTFRRNGAENDDGVIVLDCQEGDG